MKTFRFEAASLARVGSVLSTLTSVISLGAMATAMSGCWAQTSSIGTYSVNVEKKLFVVPQEALGDVMNGKQYVPFYSGTSSDPYLDATYVVQGSGHLDATLAVYNAATLGGNVLGESGGKATIKGDLNDISDVKLVVEIKSCANPFTLTVNGQAVTPDQITDGNIALWNGDLFQASGRLPGKHAVISLGALPASSSKSFDVSIDGNCDFAVHFDVFGDALCNEIFVNPAENGTTLTLQSPSTPDASLQVVPAADLAAVQAGQTGSDYNPSSSEAFEDQTYLLQGDGSYAADLVVYNPTNYPVTDAMMLVEVKTGMDFVLTVGGKTYTQADLSSGDLPLKDGKNFDAAQRMPGKYLLVAIGTVPAKGTVSVHVTTQSGCDLWTHFDVVGNWGCSSYSVNAPFHGTTIHLHHHDPVSHHIHIEDRGTCNGTVASSIGGLDCRQVAGVYTCDGDYSEGSILVLTATAMSDPKMSSYFAGWGPGPCQGQGAVCTVTMSQDYSFDVFFNDATPL